MRDKYRFFHVIIARCFSAKSRSRERKCERARMNHTALFHRQLDGTALEIIEANSTKRIDCRNKKTSILLYRSARVVRRAMNYNPTPTITESISTKTPTAYTSRIPSSPRQNFVKRTAVENIAHNISIFSLESPYMLPWEREDAQEDAKMFPCMERRALSYAIYPGTRIFSVRISSANILPVVKGGVFIKDVFMNRPWLDDVRRSERFLAQAKRKSKSCCLRWITTAVRHTFSSICDKLCVDVHRVCK